MTSDSKNHAPWGEAVQSRLWWWRNAQKKLTLRELTDAVNDHLPEDGQIALSTVSNYEARGDTESERKRASEPRASFLAALSKAFPDLNINWLVTGQGSPERDTESILERHGELEDWQKYDMTIHRWGGPRVSGLFYEAVLRIERSTPEGPGDINQKEEAKLMDLVAQLLLGPFVRLHGHSRTDFEKHKDYLIAAYHAIMLATPAPGEGRPLDELLDSLET